MIWLILIACWCVGWWAFAIRSCPDILAQRGESRLALMVFMLLMVVTTPLWCPAVLLWLGIRARL